MPSALLTMLSWVNPLLRSVRDEIYELQDDWVMDDTKYRSAFGEPSNPSSRGDLHHDHMVQRGRGNAEP